MSEPSPVPLRDYIESRILAERNLIDSKLDGHIKLNDERFSAMQRAVTKAEIATDNRFSAVNEFRGQLADQFRTLMPRAEAEMRLKVLEDSTLERQSQSKGLGQGWAILVAVVGLAGIIFGIVAVLRGHP